MKLSSSKRTLRVHWASSKPNFGDHLSPLICELLSRCPVQYASPARCDLIAIGSVLQRTQEYWWNRRIHVWGTGLLSEPTRYKSKHYYHAVRGRQTASKLINQSVNTFGDPGLLSDQLISSKHQASRYTIGIVPHYS